MTGHDQLFKDLLEEFLPDLLHIVIPEVVDKLALDDPRAIRFLKGEHFTDLPEGKRRQVDLLAQVPLREGSEELVLVHVEIERRASSAMGKRLAHYAMALELRHARPILPIVIYLKGGAGAAVPFGQLRWNLCTIGPGTRGGSDGHTRKPRSPRHPRNLRLRHHLGRP